VRVPGRQKGPNAYARMDGFLKLYGFCRNMAFVGLAGAFHAADAALAWARLGWSDHVAQQFLWALLALLIGLGMLHRYLKFFRLYNVEVFVAYSEAPSAGEQTRMMRIDVFDVGPADCSVITCPDLPAASESPCQRGAVPDVPLQEAIAGRRSN
jgi:hypothetical protein